MSPETVPLEIATHVVRAAFAVVLGIPEDELHDRDDFFALGGHSLGALALVARIEEETSVELSLALFVEQPTIGAIAHSVATANPAG